MKILSIGFSNYRSVGSSPIIVDLDKRVNLLIGANNSGKSNVLDLFQRLKKEGFQKVALSETDFHRRDTTRHLTLIFDVEGAPGANLPEGRSRFQFRVSGGSVSEWLETPFDSMDYREFQPFVLKTLGERWVSIPNDEKLRDYGRRVSAHFLGPLQDLLPEAHVIPQFRRIVSGEYSIDGTGVIELLGQWQSPEIGKDSDRDHFNKIQNFLRELLLMDDITLDVSRQGSHLLVQRGTLRLPLTNYGTGIHQLIILAIAVLARENAVIGIEEPEIHLHPLLQKAFLCFLVDKTTNRYLITTHSNAFLSRPNESNIIHLWLENGETKNRRVEAPSHILEILRDLGIRAADILQANFVIWVEGPSDRIYVNSWLRLAAPKFTERIDYSVMFYGGRLLSHLSLEQDADLISTAELIKLLRINQHSAIIIDSDKTTGTTDLNETKKRIQKECRESGVLCWITAGREIENYLPTESIAKAYNALLGVDREISLGRYQKMERILQKTYKSAWRSSFDYSANKPAFARRIAREFTDVPDELDLKAKVKELVQRIEDAN